MVTTSEFTNTGLFAGKIVVESAEGPFCFEMSCAMTSPVAFAVPAFGENSISFAFSVCPSDVTVGSKPGVAVRTT